MFYSRTAGLRLAQLSVQICFAVCLVPAWMQIVEWLYSPVHHDLGATVTHMLLTTTGLVADHLSRRGKRNDRLESSSGSFQLLTAAQQTAAVGITFFVFLFISKDATISRVYLGSYFAALFLGLVMTGKYLPGLLSVLVFHDRHRTKALLVGPPDAFDRYSSWLKGKETVGIHVVGALVATPGANSFQLIQASAPFPVLGVSQQLEEVLREVRANAVIHLDIPSGHGDLNELRRVCDEFGVRFFALCDFAGTLSRSLSFTLDDGIHVMAVRREPLESPMNRAIKRLFDICVSLPVVCFVLPPLSLLIWIVQRIQSPGPLFYRQQRVGMNQCLFSIWKFRTMHTTNPNESRQATQNDVRVYPLGRWLRRLSIDELPQFINVLLGQMSIVGPRPHMPSHDDLFAAVARSYRVRSLVKPGITGLAQVKGFRGETRCDSDVVYRSESDLFYLENWSLFLDISILCRTAPQVLFPPKNAY